MKKILGIDGSKGGWIAVKQCVNHEDHTEIDFRENLIELLTPDIKLAIIDMPVGLDKNPQKGGRLVDKDCLLYTSPSPRDKRQSRMPSSA